MYNVYMYVFNINVNMYKFFLTITDNCKKHILTDAFRNGDLLLKIIDNIIFSDVKT